jgi:hypothetical protein
MTDVATTADRPKRNNGAAHGPVLVSGAVGTFRCREVAHRPVGAAGPPKSRRNVPMLKLSFVIDTIPQMWSSISIFARHKFATTPATHGNVIVWTPGGRSNLGRRARCDVPSCKS